MICYRCPACARAMESDDALVGMAVICLGCLKPVRVPPPSPEPPPDPDRLPASLPPPDALPHAPPPTPAPPPGTEAAVPTERAPSAAIPAFSGPAQVYRLHLGARRSLVVALLASLFLASLGLLVLLLRGL